MLSNGQRQSSGASCKMQPNGPEPGVFLTRVQKFTRSLLVGPTAPPAHPCFKLGRTNTTEDKMHTVVMERNSGLP